MQHLKNGQDFKLDAKIEMRPDKLVKLVTCNTWTRIINGIRKESLLDYINIKNVVKVENVMFEVLTFVDQGVASITRRAIC